MREQLNVIRDLMDKQVVDRKGTKMGRVDGLVLVIEDDSPPRVDHLELGLAVLARRVHPRFERWLFALRRIWSPRRSARQRVPWSAVVEVTPYEVKLDLDAMETAAFDWERWLRDHVVSKIPGGG